MWQAGYELGWTSAGLSVRAVRRRKGWPLRVLGSGRPASYDDGFDGDSEPRPRRRSTRRRVALALLKIVLAGVVLLALAVGALFVLTPSAGQAEALTQAQAEQHHIAYPGPQVPPYFAEALVATEDHRFYSDPGVDPFAMARAAFSWLIGRQDQGGSTIDQQLAKNLYTSGHSGFSQVIEQMAIAVKLNMTYSRPQILQMYAEVAYYGHGYYGLDAASCGYFGRTPAELSLVQAAMLAGVVNAPTYDDPLVYPAQARARLVHVIGRMAAVGYLSLTQETAALDASLDLPATRGCQ
jgi:membrane peptidoglycan carboxypeptidase